jgi:hypothetical protein
VLAHPNSLNIDPYEEFPGLLRELVEMGLLGIECYYYNHTREKQAYYLKLAERFSIIATGGSDFHGDDRPKVALGRGTGGLFVPDEVMERLVAENERITGGPLP